MNGMARPDETDKGATTNGNTMTMTSPEVSEAPKPAPVYDARSDLLKAIREGISLRKVAVVEEKRREQAQPLHDVASILAARVAIEVDTDDSASDSDSEGWDDETSA